MVSQVAVYVRNVLVEPANRCRTAGAPLEYPLILLLKSTLSVPLEGPKLRIRVTLELLRSRTFDRRIACTGMHAKDCTAMCSRAAHGETDLPKDSA